MTQGYIGYHLQQAIQDELKARGIKKACATVVTQVVVDENDPGFQKPTKPVGSFYTKEEADAIAAEKGFTFVEVLSTCPTNWGMTPVMALHHVGH